MKICLITGCDNAVGPPGQYKLCHDCCDRLRPAGKVCNGERNISNTVSAMVKRARSRNKFDVNITTEDIYKVWPYDNKCPVFGTIMTCGKKGGRKTSPSLDRIDNTKGYEPSNIQIISSLANSMKQNANNKEMQQFCSYFIK